MRHDLNQRSEGSPGCELQRSRMIKKMFVIAIALVVVIVAASSSAHAQQTVLSVKPGWDVFDPRGAGQVIYKLTTNPCRSRRHITYILKGATPLQKYHVGVGLYNLPGDGLKSFGVSRFGRATFTREDVTAMQDAFILGEFFTDRFGNGRRSFELDLSGVPAGSYDALFTWTKLIDTRGYYRTGSNRDLGGAG